MEEVLKHADQSNSTKTSFNETYTLDQLTADVCNYPEISPADVKSSSKQRHSKQARSMICCAAVRILNIEEVDAARHPTISKSSVSKLVTGFQLDEIYTAFINKYMKQ